MIIDTFDADIQRIGYFFYRFVLIAAHSKNIPGLQRQCIQCPVDNPVNLFRENIRRIAGVQRRDAEIELIELVIQDILTSFHPQVFVSQMIQRLVLYYGHQESTDIIHFFRFHRSP